MPNNIEEQLKGLMESLSAPLGPPAAPAQVAPPVAPAADPDEDFINKAMSYYTNKGLQPHQAAGLVGNFLFEMGGQGIHAVNPNSGALGIAQFLGPRKISLIGKYGERPTLDQQLDHTWEELSGSENRTLVALRQAKDDYEAMKIVHDLYERSDRPAYDARHGLTKKALAKWQKTGSVSDGLDALSLEELQGLAKILESPNLDALPLEELQKLAAGLQKIQETERKAAIPPGMVEGTGPLTVDKATQLAEEKQLRAMGIPTAKQEALGSPMSDPGFMIGAAAGAGITAPAGFAAPALRSLLGAGLSSGLGDMVQTHTGSELTGLATNLIGGIGFDKAMIRAGRIANPKIQKYLEGIPTSGYLSDEAAELFSAKVAQEQAIANRGFNPNQGKVVYQPTFKIQVPGAGYAMGDTAVGAPLQDAHLALREQIRQRKMLGGSADIKGPFYLDIGTEFVPGEQGGVFRKAGTGTLEPTAYIFQRAEAKYPGITETLLTPLRDAKLRAHQGQLAVQEEIAAMRSLLPSADKSSIRIGKWLVGQQADGAELLKNLDVAVESLTPVEQTIAKKIQDDLRLRWFPEFNKARVLAGQQPIKPRENYFTFSRAIEKLRDKEGFNPLTVDESVIDDMMSEITKPSGVSVKTTWFPWQRERVQSQIPLHFDAFGIYERYAKAAVDFIETAPEVAKLHSFVYGFKPEPRFMASGKPPIYKTPGGPGKTVVATAQEYPIDDVIPAEVPPTVRFPWEYQATNKSAQEAAEALARPGNLEEYVRQSPQGYEALLQQLGKEESVTDALKGLRPRLSLDAPMPTDPKVTSRSPLVKDPMAGRKSAWVEGELSEPAVRGAARKPPETPAIPPASAAATTPGKFVTVKGYGNLTNEAPNLANYIMDTANKAIGVKPPPTFGRIDKVLNHLSQNVSAALLGFNPKSVLIQPLALAPSSAKAGLMNTAWGISDAFNSEKARFALEHSKVLSTRRFDITREELLDSLTNNIQSVAQKAESKIRDVSLAGMEYVDYKTALAGWWSGFRKALNDGKPFEEARDFADNLIVTAHSSPTTLERPAFQSGDLGKALSGLQSFVISEWNFLNREVLGRRNPMMKTEDSIKRMTRYMIALSIANSMYQAAGIQTPAMAPVTAYQEAREKGADKLAALGEASLETFKVMPFVGGARYGKPLSVPVVDTLGSLASGIVEGRAPGAIVDAAAKLRGVPGAGVMGRFLQTEQGFQLRDYAAQKTGFDRFFAPQKNQVPLDLTEFIGGRSGESRPAPISWFKKYVLED